MKRWIALSLPLSIVVLFLTAVVVVEAQRPPEWQEALSRYVSDFNASQPTTLRVDRVVSAKMPWNFRGDWGVPMLDYGRFAYRVEQNAIPSNKSYTGHLALPYPPQTVQCVLVREGDAERVLFVNFYSDNLWQFGWVIQAGARRRFTAEFAGQLAEIGCALSGGAGPSPTVA